MTSASPFPLYCWDDCTYCKIRATDPDTALCNETCPTCWPGVANPETLEPGMHVFEIAVRSRFSTAPGYPDLIPMGVQVRAYSINGALAAALQLPFNRWFLAESYAEPPPGFARTAMLPEGRYFVRRTDEGWEVFTDDDPSFT